MRVENPKLVVEPGAGRTGRLAMVAYQFQQERERERGSRGAFCARAIELLRCGLGKGLMNERVNEAELDSVGFKEWQLHICNTK